MNQYDSLGYFVIICMIAICAYVYYDNESFQLKCIISTVDGNKYCVRERKKLQHAADLLAKVSKHKNKALMNDFNYESEGKRLCGDRRVIELCHKYQKEELKRINYSPSDPIWMNAVLTEKRDGIEMVECACFNGKLQEFFIRNKEINIIPKKWGTTIYSRLLRRRFR